MKKRLLYCLICCLTGWATLGRAEVPPPPPAQCAESIGAFAEAYQEDEVFRLLMDNAFENMQPLPEGYHPGGNPWIGKHFDDLLAFLGDWCLFLPRSKGSSDDGLAYIEVMDFFAYQNPFGQTVFQIPPGRELFARFVQDRGAFMNSPESRTVVAQWLANPRIEKEDYLLPDPDASDGGFDAFNAFFARVFKDQAHSRPQTMPERDYVISAPTDAIMNAIPVPIVDNSTRLRTKGTQELNIQQLLAGSKHWERFVGGTALSCILMPNTYHRYHSPVAGSVIETALVDGALIGMEDFPAFVPPGGNVGRPGADFSAFENYRRGYFIIDTGKYGLVAAVPVGLSEIGSVVFHDKFLNATEPVPVQRGDELGYFLYGGSLVILVFEPGRYVSDGIKVRLGNQIGIFDTDGE
jgi:phosphatidylserine decarboxylase